MESVLTLENHQNIFQKNYDLAVELSIVDETDCHDSKTLKADNLIDLHIINVDMPQTGMHNKAVKAYLMTHLFDVDGNIAQAPEMVLLVDQVNKVLEPYSLSQASAQQDQGESGGDLIGELAKKQAQWSRFLNNWLLNLKAMDYSC